MVVVVLVLMLYCWMGSGVVVCYSRLKVCMLLCLVSVVVMWCVVVVLLFLISISVLVVGWVVVVLSGVDRFGDVWKSCVVWMLGFCSVVLKCVCRCGMLM